MLFNAASIWEGAIKAGLSRPDFPFDPHEIARGMVEAGFVELPVHADAAAQVIGLPPYPCGPFDRLLVAQAMAGFLRLLTADPLLPPYSELNTLIR